MILGDLIKQYRTETHMNMEQFAQKSGLSKAYVSILERNYNPVNGKPVVPSLETIKAVSCVIGMDFNEVISLLEGGRNGAAYPNGIGSMINDIITNLEVEQFERLLQIYKELSPARQKQLFEYASYLSMLDGKNDPQKAGVSDSADET